MPHHSWIESLVIVASATLILSGCQSDIEEVVLGRPPSLPKAQFVVKAQWREIGATQWSTLPVERASAVLAILMSAQEFSYADGRTPPMAAMDREVQFFTSDKKDFTVVLRSDNVQFWCDETTGGRIPSPKSYLWPRDLSEKELSTLSSFARKDE